MEFSTTREKMKGDRLSNIGHIPAEREVFGKFIENKSGEYVGKKKTFQLWNIACKKYDRNCTNALALAKGFIECEKKHLPDFPHEKFKELEEKNEGTEKEITFILERCEEQLEELYKEYVQEKHKKAVQ